MAQVAQAIAGLRSFRFRMEVLGGTVPLLREFRVKEAEGDVVRPDRWQARLRVPAENGDKEARIVGIGGETFVTDPASGRWVRYQTLINPPAFFQADGGMITVLRNLRNARRLSDAVVDGADSYQVRGSSDALDLEFVAGAARQGGRVTVDLWVEKSTGLLRQMRIEGPVAEQDPSAIVRLIRLSGFNRLVEIQAPALS